MLPPPVPFPPNSAADPFRAPTAGPLAGKRILTVDDQPESTRMIRLALSAALGAEVREVNDPARALAVAVEFRPHIILLDVEMPGMNGGILWRQFRTHPDFRKLPVVFLTSRISEDESSPNAPDATTQMLAKPITLARLTERLVGLLAKPEGRRGQGTRDEG